MWEVLPIYESLLSKYEGFMDRYRELATNDNACNHIYMNLNLGWQKLNEYYSKLDDSYVYVAAFVLHPRYRWKKLEYLWQSRPEWVEQARRAFHEAWKEYKSLEIGQKVPVRQPHEKSREDFLAEFLAEEPDLDACRPDWDQSLTHHGGDELDDYLNATDVWMEQV